MFSVSKHDLRWLLGLLEVNKLIFFFSSLKGVWVAVTNLKHPGSGLRSVLQESSSLFAGGFLQPPLVVHLSQTLGAPDLSAGCLVVRPHTVQRHLGSPTIGSGTRLATYNWPASDKSFYQTDDPTTSQPSQMFCFTVAGFTCSLVAHLLSPSPSTGLFLSSGYTMTSLRLKWTISSRFSPVTFTSPGKKMEP